jgi:hypothetical protein
MKRNSSDSTHTVSLVGTANSTGTTTLLVGYCTVRVMTTDDRDDRPKRKTSAYQHDLIRGTHYSFFVLDESAPVLDDTPFFFDDASALRFFCSLYWLLIHSKIQFRRDEVAFYNISSAPIYRQEEPFCKVLCRHATCTIISRRSRRTN